MSEPSTATSLTPARPLNRWGLGTLSFVQTALMLVIIVAANYLAAHHFARRDLSRSGDYTLSPATRGYLTGPDLAARRKPVKWVMAFRRTSPFYERVRALAEDYERLSMGKIELQVVDPLRSPDRIQEIMAAYGLTLARDMILMDARNDDAPATRVDADNLRMLNPHVKIVAADDMGVYTQADGVRKLGGFQGEDLLTARLVEAIEGEPRKMALVADKSRIAGHDGNPHLKSLVATLRYQNIELQPVNIAGLSEIPGEVAGLVLAAPKYDLTEAEMGVLERYWKRERAAILVLVDGEVPPRLRAFLRGNGITPHNDRIIARHKDQLTTRATGVFTAGVEFTRDLAGQTTEFDGLSCSLDVREGADDLLNRRIYPMGLIQVTDGFWGETQFGLGNEQFDETTDHRGPFHLAACVTRGAESDERFAAGTARMVVISNTDFLAGNARNENRDFLASSANWLVGRESLAGIGPRALGVYRLPLLDAQVSFINRLNLFFLPAALLLVGAFVWSSRRS